MIRQLGNKWRFPQAGLDPCEIVRLLCEAGIDENQPIREQVGQPGVLRPTLECNLLGQGTVTCFCSVKCLAH